MSNQNQTENAKVCRCEKTACGCAQAVTTRCTCGDSCACRRACACDGGCNCAG